MKVKSNDNGKRLDLIIPLYYPQYSRTTARRLLDEGHVSLNDEVEYRPNYKVETGDLVEIKENVHLMRKHLPEYKKKIPILYQDENIVIVDKPIGMKVHPIKAEGDEKTLLNALYYTLRKGISEYGINLVNRIDKGTSGLVVCAISPLGAWHYHKQFVDSKVNKEYIAVVSGSWFNKYGRGEKEISNFLEQDHNNGVQVIAPKGGKHAHTTFSLVKQLEEYAILKAQPHTGRTHQIRAHASQLGYPIVGDVRYGGVEAERLMLHSWRLKLRKPDGSILVVESEIPKSFSKLIK